MPARPATQPTVTVVIPVWDAYAGALLDDAIASVVAQHPAPAVLVVDNASEVAFTVPDDVDVITTDRRLSVGAARNAGLSEVRTPWVLFWDADDVMLPGTLDDLSQAVADDVVAVSTAILDGLTGRRHHWPRPWTAPLTRLPRLYAFVHCVSSLFPTTGAMMRTEAVRAGGGFADADGGDDWVAGVSVALRGRVVLRPRLGRLYRRHRGSVSDGWTGQDDITAHAALVRARLAEDPATPTALKRLLPVIGAGQRFVIGVLRPLSRRLPGRRRELATPSEPTPPRTLTGAR